MADGESGAEAQVAALYWLPLDEFTPARNQLAQQLRRAGERELGEQVKALRKPSVTAWTLNHLRRRQPELVDALIGTGLRLREAQERLLGEGERGRLREAAADERRLVEETVQAAEAMLQDAGQTVSAALHNKLWETTHAAALDPELGETLKRARLVEDRQISDLGLIGGLGPAARASPAGAGPAPPSPAPKATPMPTPKNQRRLEQAMQRQQKAQERLDAALRHVDEAERALARTEAGLRSAEAELRQAEADAARAGAGAAGAQSAVARARAQLQEATDRVDELEAKR